jgi:hypothetical protein
MSLLLTGGVALAYATGLVGVHRFTVFRRRARAQGYATLRWLDWDTLLAGVLPAAATVVERGLVPAQGGPAPRLLQRAPSPQADLLCALVEGRAVPSGAFEDASFSGGEARWLELLSELREAPTRVLEQLKRAPTATVAEAALLEWLVVEHEVSPLNLEFAAFASKRRLGKLFRRFGDQPALYFARARASGLLGFTAAVLDDLARAVYFSNGEPFYLEAVTQLAFVEDARPALMRACRDRLVRTAGARD